MVPNFTGRKRECDEIVSYLTCQSTRMVLIWGSPGFGKTSVANAVGHELHSLGLPVCWLTLRGLKSKADLVSKLLSFVRRPATNNLLSDQRLSLDDELCQLFSEILDPCVFILDNADDLLESGEPQVKEEVIGLLKEILSRSAQVKFLVTIRESFEFMNLDFQGHKEVRIRALDETSSQSFVHELLPNTSSLGVRRIAKICGHVPLAIKLLCSSISQYDGVEIIHDFMESSTESITEMIDNQDYPTHLRMQFLFNVSFQRLSALEKKALISFSILPESFDIEVSVAVLDENRFCTLKVLQSLRRKSLLDSSLKHGSFTMHNLVQSFAREKGEQEMKEDVLKSKARFYTFYVSRFETLNEQFLKGNSMSAFLAFCEDKESFIQSLLESCSDSRTANRTFDVLIKAELFLDSVFWCPNEVANFDNVYDSALKAAKLQGKDIYRRRLLISRAFGELTWGRGKGQSIRLLSEVEKLLPTSSSISSDEKAKHSCYLGLCQLVKGETENGVKCLKEALSLMKNSPEETVLRVIASQILEIYKKFHNNASNYSQFYGEALPASKKAGDRQFTVNPATGTGSTTMQIDETQTMSNHPLRLQVMYHVRKASDVFLDIETEMSIRNSLQKVLKEVETALPNSQPGLFNFYRVAYAVLRHFIQGDDLCPFEEEQLRSCKTALQQCKTRFGEQHASTADSYYYLGAIQFKLGDITSALRSFQSALHIRYVLFGEEHQSTADIYDSLGVTQHELGDFNSALQSAQRVLNIRRTLFGEKHQSTADSYDSLGSTQHELGDFNSALHSKLRALEIRRTLFGEKHQRTARSYYSVGVTQYMLSDLNSGLQSLQRALDIQRSLFGEEHQSTVEAHMYHSLGVAQYTLGDFNSSLRSTQHALDIWRTLFGEEHQSTANSYRSLGAIQHKLGDFNSALHSKLRALNIWRTLFGEEHQSTADSYHSLGVTQYELGDFNSALQSTQCALDIRCTLFGEEHQSTADSYDLLGVIQHELGDLNSGLQSRQRAFDIRRSLFGEGHTLTT